MNKLVSKTSGFTLVEMIIYVAIFSMIFTMLALFVGRVQSASTKMQVSTEVQQTASRLMEVIGKSIREADGLNEGGSALGVDRGRLALVGPEAATIDTHEQNFSVGGQWVSMYRAKIRRGTGIAVNITSPLVDINKIKFTKVSEIGEPAAIQVELQLDSLNPGNSHDFESRVSLKNTFVIRKDN